MLTVSDVKTHLRVDGLDFDGDIQRMLSAAVEYCRRIGVSDENLSNPQVQQAQLMFVSALFDEQHVSYERVSALLSPFREVYGDEDAI